MELNQQTAIITGASRGIGRAVAETLADRGANVVINGTNEELLKSLCTQLNTERKRASYVAGDASLPETASLLIAEAKQQFGRIDIWSTMRALICGKQPLIHRLKSGKE